MPRILLFDDSHEDADAIASLLRHKPELKLLHVPNADLVLSQLREAPPDLMLIDPFVAERSDAFFFRRAREVAPHTPMLVISALGQEGPAVRALREGAASFVPKHLIDDHLLDTIQSVLQVARKELCQARMMELMTELKCSFVLDNDPTLVAPLVGYVQDHMARMELCDAGELTRVGIAVHEALTNAIYHGNLELDSNLRDQGDQYQELCQCRRTQSPYCERRVYIGLLLTCERARITIRDQGPGFDPRRLPDPTELENVDKVSGRGIFLIRTFMDRVMFNASGNQITMWKRRDGALEQHRKLA